MHFLALTFTMSVAALDAYTIINIGFGPFASRLFSSLVILGTAAMLFCFPFWNRARVGKPRGARFVFFWGTAAAIPVFVALALLFLDDLSLLAVLVAISFVPFIASVLYGLVLLRGEATGASSEAWIAFSILCLIAVAEVTWIVLHPKADSHFFVTLPLAYIYVSVSTWRNREPAAQADVLPDFIARERGLTEREMAMVRGILEGKSNKELARDLGIAENTVRNHIYNLYRKLGIQKRLDLVVLVRKYRAS